MQRTHQSSPRFVDTRVACEQKKSNDLANLFGKYKEVIVNAPTTFQKSVSFHPLHPSKAETNACFNLFLTRWVIAI